MNRFPLAASILLLACALLICESLIAAEGVALKRVPSSTAEFGSAAVVVQQGVLLHTTQLLPLAADGSVLHLENLPAQLEHEFDSLKQILQAAGIDQSSLVRLQINLADSSKRTEVLDTLKRLWADKPVPALSLVQGKLPNPGALVAIDAIAAVPAKPERTDVELLVAPELPGHSGPVAAILPGPRVIHVAGQAEKGADPRDSTRNTLKHLRESLEWQGASWKDAVSIKCFLTPVTDAAMVREEIAAACGPHAPPVVFVEWIADIPIEIEVVASAAASPLELTPAESVKYLTPPDMTSSPVYSRMAVISASPIYVAGLVAQGDAAADPTAESRDLFRQLQEILAHPDCNSDLKHLVKATYYCSHDSTSRALNAIRPDYYEPARPPAASKAIVPGVGHPDRKITLDMIAVPKPAAP